MRITVETIPLHFSIGVEIQSKKLLEIEIKNLVVLFNVFLNGRYDWKIYQSSSHTLHKIIKINDKLLRNESGTITLMREKKNVN